MTLTGKAPAGELTAGRQVQIDEKDFARIAAGDGDAFIRLYEQTRSSIYAFAISMLRNKEEAEDVMQDAYLKIRTSAHLYQPRGKPMAWVITIVRNLCLMRLRQGRAWGLMDHDGADQEPAFDNVRNAHDRMTLQAAFHVLSDEELRVVILHAVAGLKHREIGQLMKMPLPTVLSKYRRAIGKMRRELEAV